MGGRKDPIWRVVVADQRSPRDGRIIETVGHYNAQTDPSTIRIDEDRVRDWLAEGAQPTDTVRKLLRTQGIDPTPASRPGPGRCATSSSTSRGSSWTTPTRCPSSSSRRTTARSCWSSRSAEDDYGKIIGKGGRTANALRTVIKAAAVREDRRVLVDIVD